MTKRQHLTLDEVLDVLSDDEEDDDWDEPLEEGSDDEFSDLEMDEDADAMDKDPATVPSRTSTARHDSV